MVCRRFFWMIVTCSVLAALLGQPAVSSDAPSPVKSSGKIDNGARPAEAAVLSEKTVARLDVPYGKDANQRLDVYAPRGAAGAPVVIFFHRGEWSKGDKSEVSYKPQFLNEQGIVFISANYRLSPAVTHPAHIQDVAAAVRWVYDHAVEFGGSAKRIVVMGHSAGCHLVALLALDPRYLAGVGLRPSDLRGVVAWSGGAYDLVAKVNAGGTYAPYVRQAFGEAESAWRDASPMAHVGDAKDMPPFLFASIQANSDSHQAAEALAGLITKAQGRAGVVVLEDRTHMSANHLFGAPGDTTGAILLKFIREATP